MMITMMMMMIIIIYLPAITRITHNQVYELPAGRSLIQECQRLWPEPGHEHPPQTRLGQDGALWESMFEIILSMNDATIDWADATLEPESHDPAPPDTAGPIRSGFARAPGARGTASSRSRSVPDAARTAARQWCSPVLRQRQFRFDAFKPEMTVDGVEDGVEDEDGRRGHLISNAVRLVRMPYIAEFGRELENPLAGNPKVPAPCTTHAKRTAHAWGLRARAAFRAIYGALRAA